MEFPRWRNIGAAVLAWSTYGFGSAVLEHYMTSASAKPMSWSKAIAYECTWALLLAALSPGVIWLASRFRMEFPNRNRNIAVHLAATVAYGATAHLAWSVIISAFGLEGYAMGSFFRSLAWGVAEAAPIYWLVVFVQSAGYYQERYQASLANASELNAQLARAQLHTLKMQLHPHFLFNTLHSISELIHENPGAAERMVLGLSELLRMSLETSSSMEVPLRHELRFTEIYLQMEKMRFDERLDIQLEIDDDVMDAMVPSLILQPLLENSIKHGISKRPGQGQIRLTASCVNGSLMIAIRDNGAGCDADRTPLREGIGLGTTRARLEKLYGAKQTFRFLRRQDDGAEAILTLPLRIDDTGVKHDYDAYVNR